MFQPRPRAPSPLPEPTSLANAIVQIFVRLVLERKTRLQAPEKMSRV